MKAKRSRKFYQQIKRVTQEHFSERFPPIALITLRKWCWLKTHPCFFLFFVQSMPNLPPSIQATHPFMWQRLAISPQDNKVLADGDNEHDSFTTHPSYRLHESTQVRPRLKYLQERHWSGPGPQQPASEHSGSHTMRSLAAYTGRGNKHQTKKQTREAV